MDPFAPRKMPPFHVPDPAPQEQYGSVKRSPFTLNLSFDFAQDVRKQPFTLSLSKGGQSSRSCFDKPVQSETFALRQAQDERGRKAQHERPM
jgi:hypothetical protein